MMFNVLYTYYPVYRLNVYLLDISYSCYGIYRLYISWLDILFTSHVVYKPNIGSFYIPYIYCRVCRLNIYLLDISYS